MHPSEIDRVRAKYTDQYVAVDSERPEWARFAGRVGQVRTVSFNGRALVQFEAQGDRGWYDIALEDLCIVPKPEPATPQKTPAKPAAAKSPPASA